MSATTTPRAAERLVRVERELAVAFGAQTCPRCSGPVELRRVRLLAACCGVEDGAEHAVHCPRVRRSA